MKAIEYGKEKYEIFFSFVRFSCTFYTLYLLPSFKTVLDHSLGFFFKIWIVCQLGKGSIQNIIKYRKLDYEFVFDKRKKKDIEITCTSMRVTCLVLKIYKKM